MSYSIKIKSDPVFELVKSMTKSEKRSFRIYAQRLEDSKNARFLALFDAMDRMSEFDEVKLLKKTEIPKPQFANIKSYLYTQLLTSLRQSSITLYDDIRLHEQVDFARILYSKGMYKQGLRLLDKAKQQAMELKQLTIALEIVEFEKLIESQFITNSSPTRADELTEEALSLTQTTHKANEFSNLAIQLYSLYLRKGHARNLNDTEYVKDFYAKHRPRFVAGSQGVYEQLYMNLSNYWYAYILQDFVSCYRHTQRNMDLFTQVEMVKKSLPSMFFKSYNYLLESLFYIRHHQRFVEVLADLKVEVDSLANIQDKNAEVLAYSYYYANRINLHFMEGTFTQGLEVVPEVLTFIEDNMPKIGQHHVLVFYYKIASLYFGSGNSRKCITYLNKIIDTRDGNIRSDLQCFARILRMIATYEDGDNYMMEYEIRSSYRFLAKMDELNLVQKEMLVFLRKLDRSYTPQGIKDRFKELYTKLLPYENHPYEKRAFLYLDVISWLESKMQGRPVEDVIREKFDKIPPKKIV